MHLLMNLSMFGMLGVDVFFVLSGFLITGILLRKKSGPHYYRNFYARRLLRLAPPYLITLALVFMFNPGSGKFLLLSLFYLANFFSLFHVFMAYGPLWSLSVEEHFYFIWPGLIRFTSARRLLAISAAVCLFTPVLRVYLVTHGGYDVYLSWYRFDGLAWGAIAAILLGYFRRGRRTLERTPAYLGGIGAVVLLVGLFIYARGNKALAFSLLYSAVPMLTVTTIWFAAVGRFRALAVLRSRLLRFFGDISYWIYLIHFLILYKVFALFYRRAPHLMQHGGFPLWSALVVAVLGPAILSGVVVRRWVELPALRRKSLFS